MSDAGRKPFTDKVSETVTPDSQKSTLEQAKETVTDKVDNFAGKNVPDSEKSFGQTVADNAKQGKDDAADQSASALDKAKEQGASLQETAQKYVDDVKEKYESGALGDTAQEYLESAKAKAGEAAEYIQNAIGGSGSSSTK